MIKLALCLFKYFPYGGLQADFRRILDICQQRGHAVTVYTMAWEGEQPKGVDIHIISIRAWSHHRRAKLFSQAIAKVSHQYDCIVGFNRIPGIDVYFAADVCFAWQLAQRKQPYLRYLPRYATYLALERALLQSPNTPHCLFVSPLQQFGYQNYYTIEANKSHVLPPGLAPTWCYPDNATSLAHQTREALGIASDQIMLLAVGSHFKTKGLARSLHAFAALPTAIQTKMRFVIVGAGDPRPYQRLAKKLQIAEYIHFLGAKSEVIPYMLAADMLLHPARYESAGLVIIEALALGLPVITTADCGHAYHIKQANAGIVLANPFSQSVYNTALQQALLNSQLIHDWKNAAFTYVKHTPLHGLHEHAVAMIETIIAKAQDV